jgi:hypothetical protein
MGRKRGNPNWSMPLQGKEPLCGVLVTEFELAVQRFGLKPDEYITSIRLRNWVREHKSKRYVPEQLLKAYGFDVQIAGF